MLTKQQAPPRYFKSIHIPGLYSLQCVSRVSGSPDITVYREELEALIGDDPQAFMPKMVIQKRFSHFALRHSRDKVDYYDKRGRLIREDTCKPRPYPACMSSSPVACNSETLTRHVTWLVKTPTVCCSFEAQPGQPAVTRANFYTMMDQMLNLARNDRDREHIYVVSHHSPCVRSVLVSDLTLASERTQSLFLDCFRTVKKGWPLHQGHHTQELVRTFAGCRFDELRSWLLEIYMQRHPTDDKDRASLLLSSLQTSTRLDMASIFVDSLYGSFVMQKDGNSAETISHESVMAVAGEIGDRMERVLGAPASKI